MFQAYVDDNIVTVHYTKAQLASAERFMSTFTYMLDQQAKPTLERGLCPTRATHGRRPVRRQHWTEHMDPIMLTYSNKLVQSPTEHTPKERRKHYNQLDVYVHLEPKANNISIYP